MKYVPPKLGTGEYESSLSSRFMYDTVDGLLKKLTPEDKERLKQPQVRGCEYGKLWMETHIRDELEELVMSYYLGDSQEPPTSFKKVLDGKMEMTHYKSMLQEHYGSAQEAESQLANLISRLKVRRDRLFGELRGIQELEGPDPIVEMNAKDAFANIFPSIIMIDFY